jgi:two-component system CheB/CheR fusion protein
MSQPRAGSSLVVVGASAGGVEALTELVGTLRPAFPAPIVIAQHLDPTRPSHLGDILARRSPLPVITVADHAPLHPGTIYVVPANRHVQITDHDMTVLPDGAGRPKPSVDLLLTSAAAVYGEQLIAVILTGTGSDGAAGGRAVHDAGGTVVIQNPTTAAYPGMPAALAPQTVDIVADLPQIGAILHDLLAGLAVSLRPEAEHALDAFLDQVREHSGIDFRVYKPATILRRLQRRITATQCQDLAGYAAYLQREPEEYGRLVNSFLIKVAAFLRDPELFAVLRTQVLPALIAANRSPGQALRFWSAGCATGEEAYSLAILICELLGAELSGWAVKIFATDLDGDAVAFARQGVYPAAALAGLPEELITRYFSAGPEGYTINKHVRSLVVFGEHDLGQHAPFPQLDLILCRNVLIYFTQELQQRALQLFAFALRDGGYLVLGRTETVRPLEEFFVPQFSPHKIYCRQGSRTPRLWSLPTLARAPQALPRAGQRPHLAGAQELFAARQEAQLVRAAWDSLLHRLAMGVVVVDAHYDIQDINSAARRLLSIHIPAIGEDFVHLAQHLTPRPLRAAIDGAFHNGEITSLEDIEVPHITTGEPVHLQITCYPLQTSGDAAAPATVLIQIADITPSVAARQELGQVRTAMAAQEAARTQAVADLETANTRLARQNAELQQINADLAAAHQHAEAAVARHAAQMKHLVATNRAVLAANEELARTNTVLRATSDLAQLSAEQAQVGVEEVETLNEELQAANEELETLNEQLQAAIEELNTSNTDLAARGEDLQHLTQAKEGLQHRLLQGVIGAQENERRRVARELHDDIGQALTALVLALGVIQDGLPEESERERRILEDATGLAENMMSGLRRIIADLRPPVLDDLGLVPALRRLGSDLQERAGVTVAVQAAELPGRLPPEVELTLFRVAQEALTNIGKHAHAHEARILLRCDPAQVTLQIQDDGQGLPQAGVGLDQADAPRLAAHFGLLGMQERVALLNGSFRVESAPHAGTTVQVEVPLAVG